jgi:chemotaxis protein CheD
MELLINTMLKKGAQRIHLKAKAFGGGDVLKLGNELRGGQSIGASNAEFIKTFLATERIPLLATDLGGNKGRNIFFLASDFSVYLKSIEPVTQQAIIKEELKFLDTKSTHKHSPKTNQPDFW